MVEVGLNQNSGLCNDQANIDLLWEQEEEEGLEGEVCHWKGKWNKTEYMCVNKKGHSEMLRSLGVEVVKKVDEFKYSEVNGDESSAQAFTLEIYN